MKVTTQLVNEDKKYPSFSLDEMLHTSGIWRYADKSVKARIISFGHPSLTPLWVGEADIAPLVVQMWKNHTFIMEDKVLHLTISN